MEKILRFNVNNNVLQNNITELANTIRTLLYQENPSIFELLDIDDDSIFLEPALFNFFNTNGTSGAITPLLQIIWGYLPDAFKPDIEIISDNSGVINLPRLGYYKYSPNETLNLKWDRNLNRAIFLKDAVVQELDRLPEIFLSESTIRICQHEVELLTKNNRSDFAESITATISRFRTIIDNAWVIMQKIMPDFCKLITLTTKEISIFNCRNQESKAALGYYGTAFLNIKGEEHSEVFFIDDIAHQCGHVLFYALTMPPNDYLKPTPRTLINEFTHVDWEARDIYGCLHGLFTYTTILYSLDKCLENNVFERKQAHEAIGRFCFYMDKFRKDIATMNDPLILTDKGWELFDMFKEGYDYLYNKYKTQIRKMDFSNQTYIFNYSLYANTNPLIESL